MKGRGRKRIWPASAMILAAPDSRLKAMILPVIGATDHAGYGEGPG